MASTLILASFLLIIYGQLALMSANEARSENERIVKRNSDFADKTLTAIRPKLNDEEEESENVIVFDRNPFKFNEDIISVNEGEVESDEDGNSNRVDVSGFADFGENPSIATEATLKLNTWLKKMSDLDSDVDIVNPEPLNDSEAKELLFPCARDE